MTELTGIDFRYNEQDNIRVPKLKLLLDHLIAAEVITTNDAVAALADLVGHERFSPYTGSVVTGVPPEARLDIGVGSAAAPDTVASPVLQVSRTLLLTDTALQAAGVGGGSDDGSLWLSAISGFSKGLLGTEAQPVGIKGAAVNYGQTNSGTLTGTRIDALGVYGTGAAFGPGVGIGGYFRGVRGHASGWCSGIEVQAYNDIASTAPYAPSAFNSNGIWLSANGNGDTPVGLHINNPFGRQFVHGIAFGSQVIGGKTGGVLTSSIIDDSNSVTSIDINGSHTMAIDLSGATLSSYALKLASGHAVAWSTDTGLVRSAAGRVKVTDGGAGYGGMDAASYMINGALLAKGDVGLGNVDNTSDLNKPISTATQAALDLKLNIASYTAADVLAKVLTVDGAGSGLDADLLDAQSGAFYLARGNHTGTQTAATISDFSTAADARIAAAVGTTVQAFDADLGAVGGLATTGLIARTGAGTAATRTITGTASQITVTNGDGVAGNPTISIPASPAFTGSLTATQSSTGGHTFTSQGVVMKVNSSNSNNFTFELQRAGVVAGYYGANATGPFMATPDTTVRIQASTAGADITGETRTDTLRIDVAPTVATPTPTHTFPVNLNGTVYRVPCVI